MSEGSGIVGIPLETVLVMVAELKSDESVAASFLKHHMDDVKEGQLWDATPIPELCEYYTACRQLTKIIMSLLTAPLPEGIAPESADGKLVLAKAEYITLMTLMKGLKEIRQALKKSYNISLEVH